MVTLSGVSASAHGLARRQGGSRVRTQLERALGSGAGKGVAQ